jgi:hypothetical protein
MVIIGWAGHTNNVPKSPGAIDRESAAYYVPRDQLMAGHPSVLGRFLEVPPNDNSQEVAIEVADRHGTARRSHLDRIGRQHG